MIAWWWLIPAFFAGVVVDFIALQIYASRLTPSWDQRLEIAKRTGRLFPEDDKPRGDR